MKHRRWGWLALTAAAGGALLLALHTERLTETTAQDPPEMRATYLEHLGAETYRYYCQTCHGAGGNGDGFNAFNLKPSPPDFTSIDFHQSRTDDQLGGAIAKGGAGIGRSASMPPWGRTLSSRERRAVLVHIRRFGASSIGTQGVETK